MSKLRPGCVSAMPQSMRSQPKRQTHFDRLVEDEAQGAHSVPDVQRRERSTPNARPVPSDGSDQLPTTGRVSSGRRAYHSNRRTWTEDEGPASTPSFRSALPAKDQRQLRFGSIPSWETGGERIILRSCPCNRDHAPRFLWSETLEKAKQRSHYQRPETRKRGPAGPLPHIAAKVFTKVDGDSPQPGACYFRHSHRVSTRRSSSHLARALRVS